MSAPSPAPVELPARELLVRLHRAADAVHGADHGLHARTVELIDALALVEHLDLAVADVFARALLGDLPDTAQEGSDGD